ncbi:hypothetical protein ANTRET_LOCUS7931 [Anthophora retusa]
MKEHRDVLLDNYNHHIYRITDEYNSRRVSLIQDTCWIDVKIIIINLQKEEPSAQCTKSIPFCIHKIHSYFFHQTDIELRPCSV